MKEGEPRRQRECIFHIFQCWCIPADKLLEYNGICLFGVDCGVVLC